MSALLLNHLWQSSLCACGVALLVLALHRNGASVRFWLWFAASIKFLVPFALLTFCGAQLFKPVALPAVIPAVTLMEPLARPFPVASVPLPPAADLFAPHAVQVPALPILPRQPGYPNLESVFLALWVAGSLAIAVRWFLRWLRVRAVLREAEDLRVESPVAVKLSTSRMEPGLVGILRPVIMLPQGIESQITPVELKAVIAHELCHWRRRDNLLAAVHMLVEALFWYFPIVWWLGARLNAERELACDESVLAEGNDPEIYAEGILKICRSYLQSPLDCVAGVSGADLKNRISSIVENRGILGLGAARKVLLSASGAAVTILPLVLGILAPGPPFQATAAPLPVRPVIAQIAVTQTLAQQERREANRITPPAWKPRLLPATAEAVIAAPEHQSVHVTDPVVAPSVLALLETASTSLALPAEPDSSTCTNTLAAGRVISANAVLLPGFTCQYAGIDATGNPTELSDVQFGSCPHAGKISGPVYFPTGRNRLGRQACPFDVVVSVQLADPSDAGSMQPGQTVILTGLFRLGTDQHAALTVTNARIQPVVVTDQAIVCRAPLLLDLSKQLGRNLCVQNDMLESLNETGPSIVAIALTALHYPYINRFHRELPANPDAITCRGDWKMVCARNSYWLAMNLR